MESYNWVELAGFRFYAEAPADPFIGGALTSLNGWRGLPGARGSGDPRPGGHGTLDRSSLLREGRSIELRGGLVADSPLGSANMLDDLEERVGAGPVMMRVNDVTGVWQRSVEVLNLIPGDRWIDAKFPITVDIYAPDPIRYREPIRIGPIGMPERIGGLVLPAAMPWNFGTATRPELPVENVGRVVSRPVAIVQGSADAVTVTGGPRRVMFGEFSGELVIDSLHRRVWLNGSDVTRELLRRNWHEVPPGATHNFSFAATNAAADTTLSVEYQIGSW